jgi:N6-adenosine-specific RNA methylase IME4
MDKRYSIIYADPAWSYHKFRDNGNGTARSHYDTMSVSEIMSIDVKSLAAQDCALFLWATMPCLPEAIQVMRAWGFQYKTCAFTWVKINKDDSLYEMGMGSYTRSNAELCLLGTRGKPVVRSHCVPQIVFAPRQEHSVKPAIVRYRITQLYGDLLRIELFARQSVKGWTNNGGEELHKFCGEAELVRVELLCDTCGWHETFTIQSNEAFYCSQCGRRYKL